MKLGSLCSGVGGLELGLERALGVEVCWQVEISEYCREVLAKHWPEAKRFDDIHTVGAHCLDVVDIICAGFPCQPSSLAGKRKGRDDERWLWPEVARIIGELRPSFVVLENVGGLRSLEDGEAFRQILADLAELGFDAEWSTLRASDVGAPHKRERLFVLAWRRGMADSVRQRLQESFARCHGDQFSAAS